MSDEGFLSRWSRRKALVREDKALSAEPAAAAAEPVLRQARDERTGADRCEPIEAAPSAPASNSTSSGRTQPEPTEPTAPPPSAPTLDDVAQLTRGSDYRRFVAPGVDPQVKNAALKRLFTDPQFNVMDGLDVYIDDYGKPDPIPASMLRQMVQSRALGLFADEEDKAAVPARQAVALAERADPDGMRSSDGAPSLPHESTAEPVNDPDPAVRLQPDDAAGPARAGPDAGEDAGRER